jgi:hypothetical protein
MTDLPPPEPAMGQIPPPLPNTKKGRFKKKIQSKFVKPVPQPGKYEPLLNFTSIKEELEASTFDLNLTNPLDDIINNIAHQSQDALARMNVKDITPDAISASLSRMVDIYMAAKLIETSSLHEQSRLRTFSSIKTNLKDAPIPAPLVDIVNTLGNFESKDEMWKLRALPHKVLALFAPPSISDTIAIRSDVDWRSFVSTIAKEDLIDLDVSYQFGNESFTSRGPITYDPDDPASVTALTDRLTPGSQAGEVDEVKGRTLISRLIKTTTIPSVQDRRDFIVAMKASFDVTIDFESLSPSTIKERNAEEIEEYQ